MFDSQSAFVPADITPVSIPEETPALIFLNAQPDEQALLARVRYNKLIFLLTRVLCFHLESHFSAVVPRIGKVEIDEIYLGYGRTGMHYVLPVQASAVDEEISRTRIEHAYEICHAKYPNLTVKPIGVLLQSDNTIVLFEFGLVDSKLEKVNEAHFNLSLA